MKIFATTFAFVFVLLVVALVPLSSMAESASKRKISEQQTLQVGIEWSGRVSIADIEANRDIEIARIQSSRDITIASRDRSSSSRIGSVTIICIVVVLVAFLLTAVMSGLHGRARRHEPRNWC